MMVPLTCFKTYDVRGKLGVEFDDQIAYRIGRAYAQNQQAKRVVIGCDARQTSESLKQSVAKGLMHSGADVIDIGLTGTEEVYFASFYLDVDGGIEITASHNPLDYNGMKFIKKGGVPLHQEHEYLAIKSLAEENRFKETTAIGSYKKISILDAYVKHILGLINARNIIKPLKLVVNAGNGAAGHVIDKIESVFNKQKVPIRFIKILHEPDGNFPHGIPNPLLPENHPVISEAVMNNQADLGIAWDGDFDRCFLFDEKGQFIEGYYLVGLLAEAFLRKNPREKIIHDSRLTWNTIDVVTKAGGIPIESRTGHAFMKERMRAENALYGGEVSAHHYFREFAYCDSGMIPWLKVVEILSSLNQPLSMLIEERKAAYPCSGELNFKVDDPSGFIAKVKNKLNDSLNGSEIPNIMTLDGISVEFKDWRFNLRPSNTEPLIRLNLETRKDPQSLKSYMSYVQSIIKEVSY